MRKAGVERKTGRGVDGERGRCERRRNRKEERVETVNLPYFRNFEDGSTMVLIQRVGLPGEPGLKA